MSLFRGYIGTYTKAESKGVYTFTLDTEKKTFQELELAAELGNPTYVNLDEDQTNLYAVVKDGDKGGVASYTVDAKSGALTHLTTELTDDGSPCHVSVNEQTAVTANYHSGRITLFPLQADGGVTPASSFAQHEGTGPHDRQEKPHAHFSGFTPDQQYIVAVDLGTDKLVTYTFENNELIKAGEFSFNPGSGPRHLAFHPKEKYVYVFTELSNEIVTLAYEDVPNAFREVQVVSTLPDDFIENSQGSAIHVSSDGRFVYAANRGHDSIAVFEVNPYSGELTLVQRVSSAGNWPRDFVLDPTESFVIVSNEETGNVVLFERNKEDGTIIELSSTLEVSKPVCLKFVSASIN
ncbi:lactonase family protein [Alkalicoccobacillus porphyridii]|uniref:Lactonase family protein n=1 Tax=Alkalicoccobacillus porphyridii TaxID=2597270 RepID=A0A553ZVX2_9BACI|nr:lactonase family protein [Alkalicoccobacillus porphyridii]TSB45456.1 lactonase family protein [Alkalicoccobacillus porphyridii]